MPSLEDNRGIPQEIRRLGEKDNGPDDVPEEFPQDQDVDAAMISPIPGLKYLVMVEEDGFVKGVKEPLNLVGDLTIPQEILEDYRVVLQSSVRIPVQATLQDGKLKLTLCPDRNRPYALNRTIGILSEKNDG